MVLYIIVVCDGLMCSCIVELIIDVSMLMFV